MRRHEERHPGENEFTCPRCDGLNSSRCQRCNGEGIVSLANIKAGVPRRQPREQEVAA